MTIPWAGARLVAGLFMVAVLAGCASRPPAPVRQAESSAARPAATPPPAGAPAPEPPGAGRRGGGYYLDDGPGTGAAVDPATVPDAVPRTEPLHTRANRPYVIFGREYVPMTGLQPYIERGTATWYGRRYHGQRTSSGEPYDMYAMTAAHPTLPIPSYAQVTNLRNGRQVVVRVNDRGPFLHGRVIDLSWTAASRLGYVQAGSAEVEVVLIHDPIAFARNRESAVVAQAAPAVPVQVVQVAVAPAGGAAVSDPARPQPLALETQSVDRQAPAALVPGIWLQMGAFSQAERAQVARDRGAAALGLPADRLVVQPASGLWRLLAGPYGSRGEAMAAAERVRQATDLAPIPITVGP